MKKIFTFALALAFAWSASAQKTVSLEGADEIVRLWDNSTAQYSNYETRDEIFYKKKSFMQTSSCELYIFKAKAEKNTGIAIAMYPGGSYTKLNVAMSLAKWYASQGYTAAIVKYRLPNFGHNKATLEDGMGAVRYLRTRTDLGIDPQKVGVMGSSAGGHLASWVSNAMPDGEKPAFAILHYAWINLLKSNSAAADKALKQLLGNNYTTQDTIDLSTYHMVSATTSPTLLFLCDDDGLVPSVDAAEYYEALIRHGVKATMHIYPYGGHSIKRHYPELMSSVVDWFNWLGLTK